MPSPQRVVRRIFLARPSHAERVYLTQLLRQETVGGALLLVATVVALVWANSPWQDAYDSLRDHEIGPAALRLHLPLSEWGGDGLLALFFFVAGLELKRELTVGSLRRPAEALLPIGAALAGHGRAGADLPALHARRPRRCPRLGDPHGHGHRVLPGRPRGRGPGAPVGPARVPPHPCRRRRPGRHHDHRPVLCERRRPVAAGRRAAAPARLRRAAAGGHRQLVWCCCRWPCSRGD